MHKEFVQNSLCKTMRHVRLSRIKKRLLLAEKPKYTVLCCPDKAPRMWVEMMPKVSCPGDIRRVAQREGAAVCAIKFPICRHHSAKGDPIPRCALLKQSGCFRQQTAHWFLFTNGQSIKLYVPGTRPTVPSAKTITPLS